MNTQTLVALGGYCGRLGNSTTTGTDFVAWSAVIAFLDGMRSNRAGAIVLLNRLLNDARGSAFLARWLKRQIRRIEAAIVAARHARSSREAKSRAVVRAAWEDVAEVDDSQNVESEVVDFGDLSAEQGEMLSWAMAMA